MELLRSRKLQKKVNKWVRELKQNSLNSGSVQKFKLQRGGGGGGVEVLVQQKVNWPHEPILV